jgi:uncharacterized membrane protein YfcA
LSFWQARAVVLYLLLFALTLVGIVVQSSVGFGFAFFVAPVAVALLRPQEAVTLLLLLGLATNSLVLLAEGRRIDVVWRTIAILLVASLPGLAVGVLVVRAVSTATLQIVIGLLILGAAAVQARQRELAEHARERRPHLVLAGLAAGVLTTATSLNGPAVVLGLLSLGWRGNRLRDGIAAALLAMSVLGTIALLAAGSGRAMPPLWIVAVCVPLIAAGHRIGAAIFRGLNDRSHRRLVIGASVVAGLASLAVGVF